MSLPIAGWGILSYLALIVPRIVFIMVRSQLRGFRDVDRTVGARLLLAFVVSIVFDAVYLASFGGVVLERLQTGTAPTPSEVALVGWLFIVPALIIQAVVSWAIYGAGKLIRPLREFAARIKGHLTDCRYESTPTAWDVAATTTAGTWVRVRLEDGGVGGRFRDRSYFSTYPEHAWESGSAAATGGSVVVEGARRRGAASFCC